MIKEEDLQDTLAHVRKVMPQKIAKEIVSVQPLPDNTFTKMIEGLKAIENARKITEEDPK